MSNSMMSNKGFTDLLPQTVEHKVLEEVHRQQPEEDKAVE